MKHKLLTVILITFAFAINSKAQVTIGSGIQPMDGVLLDIKEQEATTTSAQTSTKGFMLPKVALTTLSSLTDINGADLTKSEQYAGLTIYNVTNTANIPQGLYIWNGSAWNTLNNPDPLDVFFSSGIFNKQTKNNNWEGIYTGTKDAKLEFVGRSSRGARAFTFSILYSMTYPIVTIQEPVISGGSASISIIDSKSFTLSITVSSTTTSFDFVLTTDSKGYTSIVATPNPAGGWIQGTWKSTPNRA